METPKCPTFYLGPALALLTLPELEFQREKLEEYQFMDLDNASALEKETIQVMLFGDTDKSTITASPATTTRKAYAKGKHGQRGQRRVRKLTSPTTSPSNSVMSIISDSSVTSAKDTIIQHNGHRSSSHARTRGGRSGSGSRVSGQPGPGAPGRGGAGWVGWGRELEWDSDKRTDTEAGAGWTEFAEGQDYYQEQTEDYDDGEYENGQVIGDGPENFDFDHQMMNHYQNGGADQMDTNGSNGVQDTAVFIPIPGPAADYQYQYPEIPAPLEVPVPRWYRSEEYAGALAQPTQPFQPYRAEASYSSSPGAAGTRGTTGTVFYAPLPEGFQRAPSFIMTPSPETPNGFPNYWNSHPQPQPQPAYQYPPGQAIYTQAPTPTPTPTSVGSYPGNLGTFFPFPPPANFGVGFGYPVGNGYVSTPPTPGTGQHSYNNGFGAGGNASAFSPSHKKKRNHKKNKNRSRSTSESFGPAHVNINTAHQGQNQHNGHDPVPLMEPPNRPNDLPLTRDGRDKPNNSYCHFCWKNNETYGVFSNHSLRNAKGELTCPILMRYVCPICKGTGVDAHTQSYCPQRNSSGSDAEPIYVTRKGAMATVGKNPFRN